MASPAGKKRKKRVQYAALPYRRGVDGVEILLVTSRETRRWVVPKGWPMKGLKPHAAARREALEEAGVVGRVVKNAAGIYEYEKRLRTGLTVTCRVHVFPLRVREQRERWREMGQREVRWFSAEGAAGAVAESDLAEIILRFQASRRKPPKSPTDLPPVDPPPTDLPAPPAADQP